MTNNTALVERIEAASEGSRELEAEIALAIGGDLRKGGHGFWYGEFDGRRESIEGRPDGVEYDEQTGKKLPPEKPPLTDFAYRLDVPRYTTSIDAALTLVPESCGWAVYEHGSAQVGRNTKQYFGAANTPALAICAAALRARSEK